MAERRTFRKKAVHHATDKFEFVLQTEIDEVGINQDTVRRDKGGVMGQEEGRGGWGTVVILVG
jgi:hypothetical protein